MAVENYPQIHDASGAFFGFDIMAAQKYGPPLVGWALQTSRCKFSFHASIVGNTSYLPSPVQQEM